MNPLEDRDRLTTIYDAYAHRVYGYAMRHCGPGLADDVVAEVFATAWRRREHLPDEPLGWLLVTARNVIGNLRRSQARQSSLTEILTSDDHACADHAPAAEDIVVEQQRVLEALDSLSAREREALLLVAWDGLDTTSAARVARCTPRAFRARLTRARVRLTATLSQPDVESDPEPHTTPLPEGATREYRPASA